MVKKHLVRFILREDKKPGDLRIDYDCYLNGNHIGLISKQVYKERRKVFANYVYYQFTSQLELEYLVQIVEFMKKFKEEEDQTIEKA